MIWCKYSVTLEADVHLINCTADIQKIKLMATSPAALRLHVPARKAFDSYFPLEDYRPLSHGFDSDVSRSGTPEVGAGASDETKTQRRRVKDDEMMQSLPFAVPLSTLREHFRREDFDPDAFLVAHQRHTSLDELSKELRDTVRLLDERLIGVVERDYEDFIGLGAISSRVIDGALTDKFGRKADEPVTAKMQLEYLQRGVKGIVTQVKRLERDLSGQVAEIDVVVAQRKRVRREARSLQRFLRASRSIDEAEYMLDQEDDLDSAVDALRNARRALAGLGEGVWTQVDVDELSTKYTTVRLAVERALRQGITSSQEADDKLRLARLLAQLLP
ncbi:hypothetical protein PYCC9005_001290 [Savitreella phatthalungensis]